MVEIFDISLLSRQTFIFKEFVNLFANLKWGELDLIYPGKNLFQRMPSAFGHIKIFF